MSVEDPAGLFGAGSKVVLRVQVNDGTERLGAPISAGLVATGSGISWIEPPDAFEGDVTSGQVIELDGILRSDPGRTILRGYAGFIREDATTAPGSRSLSLMIIEHDGGGARVVQPELDPDVTATSKIVDGRLTLLLSSSMPAEYRIDTTHSPRVTLSGPGFPYDGELATNATLTWDVAWLGPREDGTYQAFTLILDYEPKMVPARHLVEYWATVDDGAVIGWRTDRPVSWQ